MVNEQICHYYEMNQKHYFTHPIVLNLAKISLPTSGGASLQQAKESQILLFTDPIVLNLERGWVSGNGKAASRLRSIGRRCLKPSVVECQMSNVM